MCARRFLILVFILILLAVAGAFAIFQFGQRVLLSQATPKGAFVAPPPRSGPDYAAAASWIAHPGLADDPSRWQPGDEPRPLTKPAHLFYVHPTTYLQTDRWNAPLKGAALSDDRAALFVRSQSSAFNHVATVWAPKYRQAAYGAFLLKSGDARAALDLAYGDVRAAFDRFVTEIPPGEPLLLAGHSQGALHLSRLLAERGPQLKERLVAAYVVGWPISTAADLPAMGLGACETPEQTGCLFSWQSFAEPANPDLILAAWEETQGPTGRERRRADMLCVNPLTGTAGGAAAPSANAGTLVPTADLASAVVVAGKVGARCDQGLLLLSGEIPLLGPYVLPGNNYHVYDYALFWGSIRRDAERRLDSWINR